MKKISFIYFDLGGVVVSNSLANARIAKETGRSVEEVQKFLDTTDDLRGRGLHDMKQFLGEFKSKFGIHHPAVDFADFWSDYLVPIEETHALIRSLIPHYKLGILSNAERGVVAHNIKKGKVPNISWSAIVESAEVGFIKPEKEIYLIAQKKAGVHPREVLLIDDRKQNIEMAQQLGWQGERFDDSSIVQSVEKLRKKLLGRK